MSSRRGAEAYLQAIFELEEDDIDVLQARIAERLDVSRPAVSEMIRRLVDDGLVHFDGHTLSLTPAGLEHGTAVVRRHRLAERFLTDVLEMGSGDAHREAERWEHVISASVEAALDRYLDHPTTCPHGNPIPRSGYMEPAMIALSEVPVGERVHVERIPERLEVIAGLLDQLERDGLVRGLTVSVIDRRGDRSTLVRTGRGDIWVDADVSDHLLVTVGDIDRITDELRGVRRVGREYPRRSTS
jgi:DtxR family transcriptional regulator, Mn-dependent transcriptional regulator